MLHFNSHWLLVNLDYLIVLMQMMYVQLQINDNRFEDAEEMEHENDSDGGHHWVSLCRTSSGCIFMRIFLFHALKFATFVNLFSKYSMIGWRGEDCCPFLCNLPSNIGWCIVKIFNAELHGINVLISIYVFYNHWWFPVAALLAKGDASHT